MRIRPIDLADAAQLSAAYRRNREHLRPWEPLRDEEFYTTEGQQTRLAGYLAEGEAGRCAHWILTENGHAVGMIALNGIVRGPFRTASVGYWIDAECTGRGYATEAVTHVSTAADTELGLHRLEASTLLENVGSQRVLKKCGFEPIGLAPAYLHINGAWRDHRLFQLLLNDRPPGGA